MDLIYDTEYKLVVKLYSLLKHYNLYVVSRVTHFLLLGDSLARFVSQLITFYWGMSDGAERGTECVAVDGAQHLHSILIQVYNLERVVNNSSKLMSSFKILFPQVSPRAWLLETKSLLSIFELPYLFRNVCILNLLILLIERQSHKPRHNIQTKNSRL